MVAPLTKDNFDAFLEDSRVVVVYFWAEWCQPCHAVGQAVKLMAPAYDDVKFGSVNTEVQTELAKDFNIRSIPTLAIFRDNVALCMESGALPESAIRDLIQQAQKLDMASVHKKIAENLLKD